MTVDINDIKNFASVKTAGKSLEKFPNSLLIHLVAILSLTLPLSYFADVCKLVPLPSEVPTTPPFNYLIW